MKELLRLAELGQKMRDKQKEYFKYRSLIVLGESKILEKEFDKLVKEIINPVQEVIPPNQISLL